MKKYNVLIIQCLYTILILILPICMVKADQPLEAKKHPFLPIQVHAVSTIPPNGDLNPYGVAFVPSQFPTDTVKHGDILVSNFNNKQNLQGTGSTIVDIPKKGPTSVFFQGNGLMGLTTALNVLKKGFVLVGNFPSIDGTCTNAKMGSLLVIDSKGQQVQEFVDPSFINGPWDSTLFDQGDKAKLFVANALTGTVVRFDLVVGPTGLTIEDKTQIASGYLHQCDPVTFVDAPTGLVYNPDNDVLYVSSTLDNAVFAVSDAGKIKHDGGRGLVIFSNKEHLHGALAMTRTPNGDLIVSNNDAINPDKNHPSALTEFTPSGKFIKEITVDSNPGGAFGLNVHMADGMTRLAAVDDNQNLILIWYMQN